METFADARKRHLTPDARITPSRVRTFALPVEIDDASLARQVFTPEATNNWADWYGLNFSPFDNALMDRSIVVSRPPSDLRGMKTLGGATLLADLDLRGEAPPLVNESVDLAIGTSGRLNGLLVYFDLDVGPGQRLSTSPAEADETCSWLVKTWLYGRGMEVKAGDKLKVSYRYRVDSPGTRIEIVRS